MKSSSHHQTTLEKLRDRGMRITKIRRELVDYILGTKDHWTIQDLAERLQTDMPSVGIATIYRTVNLLVDEGAVTRTIVDHGPARFEVTPEEHHDHLSCVICGKIVEFENDQIEKLQEKIAEEHGFVLKDHRMELFGECRDCLRRKKKSSVKEK